MQAIHADNVNWKSQSRGVREAKIFSKYNGSEETRIDIVEVPAGGYIPPHRHSSRREFITILLSAGAQLQIGDRVFRPIAGQVFHREPEDILALTNDSHHPFRYSVVRFGFEASDIEWLNEEDAALMEDRKAARAAALEAKQVARDVKVEAEEEEESTSDEVAEEEVEAETAEEPVAEADTEAEDEGEDEKEEKSKTKTSKKSSEKSKSDKSKKSDKKDSKSEKSSKSDKKKKPKKKKK